jgi:hypothetical protein
MRFHPSMETGFNYQNEPGGVNYFFETAFFWPLQLRFGKVTANLRKIKAFLMWFRYDESHEIEEVLTPRRRRQSILKSFYNECGVGALSGVQFLGRT